MAIVSRGTIAKPEKHREAGTMTKKQKESLIERISRAVDEGATEEIDIQQKNLKLFGGALKLMGKVKFHMDPMKKSEDRQ